MTGPTVWREPAAETEHYPGLVVHENRVSGSITVGRSRLPLWAFIADAIDGAWPHLAEQWDLPDEFGQRDLTGFLYHLLEARGEFGRLLCILANEDRVERGDRPWWQVKAARRRVTAQLHRCLAALDETPADCRAGRTEGAEQ